MIQAKELRKGNYVADIWAEPESMFKVKYIQRSCTYGSDLKTSFENLIAIPLTIPTLLKFGFIEQNFDGLSWLEHPGDHSPFTFFTGDKNGILEVVIEFHGEEMKRVKYLHELQNLFFYLTGEDLEVAI